MGAWIMVRFDLTDVEWSLIAPLLRNKPRGVPRQDDRRVLNGIFYTLRTGSPWRDRPERYGPYTTAYNRFNRWAKAGVWLKVFETLAQHSPKSLDLIDSSILRAHQHAGGGKRGPGSRHWPFSWRTEHQDPRCRRSTRPAGAPGPDARPSLRQDHVPAVDRRAHPGPQLPRRRPHGGNP
ncbi:MAG: IS5 family transposase, partial [Alphaproteobacteria bacterium]|nr:IS5 family transposase [Alphaproteobacteria bacterium]